MGVGADGQMFLQLFRGFDKALTTYMYNVHVLGAVSRKPRKLFGPVKP